MALPMSKRRIRRIRRMTPIRHKVPVKFTKSSRHHGTGSGTCPAMAVHLAAALHLAPVHLAAALHLAPVHLAATVHLAGAEAGAVRLATTPARGAATRLVVASAREMVCSREGRRR